MERIIHVFFLSSTEESFMKVVLTFLIVNRGALRQWTKIAIWCQMTGVIVLQLALLCGKNLVLQLMVGQWSGLFAVSLSGTRT